MILPGLTVLLAVSIGALCPDGLWVGAWTVPGQPSMDFVLTLQDSSDHHFTGRVESVAGGLHQAMLEDASLQGSVVTFKVGGVDFRGTLDDMCQTIAGTTRINGSKNPGVFHAARRHAVRQDPSRVSYHGEILIGETEIVDLAVHLVKHDGRWLAEVDQTSSMNSPIEGYPVDVRTDVESEGILLLEFPSRHGGTPVSLALEPVGATTKALWTTGRDQHIITLTRTDTPLQTLEAPGEPMLSGRLVFPDTDGPHPLVFLIGEVGTDLDGIVAGTPVMESLASVLDEQGFATFRMHLPDAGFKERVRATRRWMDWLQANEAIDLRKLALVGHGGGASIVARYAATFGDNVSAVVLLSLPGKSGRLLMEDLILAAGQPNETQQALAAWRTFIDFAMHDANEKAIRIAATEWIAHRRALFGEEQVSAAADEIDALMLLAVDPEWRLHMGMDPRMSIARIRGIPVLALQGDRDATFDGPNSLTALTEIASQRGVDFKPRLIPGLDHSLAIAETPNEVAASAREALTTWLVDQLQMTAPRVSP
jgi:pimeloyl-ACP methyl ester carboxylesterase